MDIWKPRRALAFGTSACRTGSEYISKKAQRVFELSDEVAETQVAQISCQKQLKKTCLLKCSA